MGRQKIKPLTPRLWIMILGGFILGVVFLTWVSHSVIRPFPPDKMVMVTGMEGGSYVSYGEQYRQILAREGINVILRSTSGSVENLKLLSDMSQDIDAGFVQGIIGGIGEKSNLSSLGSITYSPLWVFYRSREVLDDLSQLRGLRIAIGPEGSGVRKFSLDLLKMAQASGRPTTLLELPNAEARKALLDGRVDVIMLFGAAEGPIIRDLLKMKDIRLMSFSQAEAYTRHFTDLVHVVMPRGVIDPAKRFPPEDVHLVSPTTNLIVRRDTHPALIYLLLKAAVEIHSGSSLINKAGEFPSIIRQDDVISEQAHRFYKSGGSWWYNYLPFWVAAFVDRIFLILIPMGMIIVPLIGIAPWIYTWRNRSKYYPWYRELRKLENELTNGQAETDIDEYLTRLDRIEKAVGGLRTSVAFYDEIYILKEHIQVVRQKLTALSAVSSQDMECRKADGQ